jgi:predicted Zn-dependent protease
VASGARQATPTPVVGAPTSVWVLTPVGLNMHQQPSTSATVLLTLGQAAQLTVLGSQREGGQTWLHVRTGNGNDEGWVVDSDQYLIDESVETLSDATDNYSMLYPSGWQVKSGNPATLTAPAGSTDAKTMVVAVAATQSALPAVPMSPGTEQHQDEPTQPVLIAGVTAFVVVYHDDDGDWEIAVAGTVQGKAYLFDLTQPDQTQPDLSLFDELVSSVSVPPV